MSALGERLATGAPLVLDGAVGTMLIAAGSPLGEPPERFGLERPDVLEAVHRRYVEAGSEALHTNTFGANAVRLARFGLEGAHDELNRSAVARARAAGARFVVGDVGPTGERLPPGGSGDPSAFAAAFLAQARLLASAGVDALHVETMSDLREALIALAALRRAAPDTPIWVSLTFARRGAGFFTPQGDALAASLRALVAAGADAVGANCSLASGDMRALAREARAAVRAPLVLQPNAGEPEVHGDRLVYRHAPEDFADDMAAVVATGAEVVGGCCGTDPRFIAALRARLGAPVAAAAPPPAGV